MEMLVVERARLGTEVMEGEIDPDGDFTELPAAVPGFSGAPADMCNLVTFPLDALRVTAYSTWISHGK